MEYGELVPSEAQNLSLIVWGREAPFSSTNEEAGGSQCSWPPTSYDSEEGWPQSWPTVAKTTWNAERKLGS